MVGNADNPTAGEEDLQETLERALVFNLVTFADDNELARDFDPGLVIISTSVNANTLNDEWANERLPIIVLDDEVYPFMGMTDDGANDHDVDNNDTIEIEDSSHPIFAGFKNVDEVIVADDDIAMAVGSPDGDGKILASAGNGNDGAIFEFGFGDELSEVDNEDARIARHRRIGFFVAEADILELNADGEELLENILIYAWSGSLTR